ncbi:Haemagglutinin [Serratia fonticola]|uniref:Haemagglutinin n=1 Tax=Serratia fonticola TaxID=47917 RepID=A0A4U9W282_SERFO|nr:Haemagglutinin [Serratia fonticola]
MPLASVLLHVLLPGQTTVLLWGKNTAVSGKNNVALGAGAVSDGSTLASAAYNPNSLFTLAGTAPVGEVSIGSAGNERRIINVAAGAQDTDAVNVSQLKSVASGLTHYYSVNDNGAQTTTTITTVQPARMLCRGGRGGGGWRLCHGGWL